MRTSLVPSGNMLYCKLLSLLPITADCRGVPEKTLYCIVSTSGKLILEIFVPQKAPLYMYFTLFATTVSKF